MGDAKIMWSAVCSLAPQLLFDEEARPHLYMDKPKCPMPVHRRLSMLSIPSSNMPSHAEMLTIYSFYILQYEDKNIGFTSRY